MVPPLVAAALPSLISLAASLIGKGTQGTQTVKQEPLETPEQAAARKQLLEFANSAGTYGGETGNYGLSGLEQTAQDKMGALLGSGTPEMLQLAKGEITKLLSGGAYDPNAEGGMYTPMKKQILREARGQEDVINRNAAISGDLYSTAMVGERGKLAENTSNTLSGILAELTDKYNTQRLGAVNTAAGLAGQEESMMTNRIANASQVGSVERLLKDAQLKAKYAEWVRSRGEKLDTLGRVVSATPNYGVKEMPVYQNGSWDKLLEQAIQGIGSVAGKYAGGTPAAVPALPAA